MYGNKYFKVLSTYKGIKDDGQEGNFKETFLTESANHADSYYLVSELATEIASDKDSVDVVKVDRIDKLTKLLYSSVLSAEESVRDGYFELTVDRDSDKSLYSVKVVFEIPEGDKIKRSTDLYYVPGTSPIQAINHVHAHLKNSTFDYKISDTKPTPIDTILILEATYRSLVSDYDMLKDPL